MANLYFFESSALVKRYVTEPGTAFVNRLLINRQATHFIARLTQVEISSAIVRRSTPADAVVLLGYFARDVNQAFTRITVDDRLLDQAVDLLAIHRLRAGDAIQLAAALTVWQRFPDLLFISADDELNTAATAEGLTVENPNWHA